MGHHSTCNVPFAIFSLCLSSYEFKLVSNPQLFTQIKSSNRCFPSLIYFGLYQEVLYDKIIYEKCSFIKYLISIHTTLISSYRNKVDFSTFYTLYNIFYNAQCWHMETTTSYVISNLHIYTEQPWYVIDL